MAKMNFEYRDFALAREIIHYQNFHSILNDFSNAYSKHFTIKKML